MAKLFHSKKGITLVETLVACILLVILIVGISVIFINSNKIYGVGVDKSEAKEVSAEIIETFKKQIQTSESIMLKNYNYTAERSLIARDGMLILKNGEGSSIVGGKAATNMQITVKFIRSEDFTVELKIEVASLGGTKVYETSNTVVLENMKLTGDKILIQDDAMAMFDGVEFYD